MSAYTSCLAAFVQGPLCCWPLETVHGPMGMLPSDPSKIVTAGYFGTSSGFCSGSITLQFILLLFVTFRPSCWNAHSIRKKYIAVAEAITSHDFDLLAVTESWHQTPAEVSVQRSIPPNYFILDRLRVKPIILTSPPTTFKALGASVTSAHGLYTILVIYRPGSIYPTSTFF